MMDKTSGLLGTWADGAQKGLGVTSHVVSVKYSVSCESRCGTTHRTKLLMTSNGGVISFPSLSIDLDISSVAVMLAIIYHTFVSPKCLPGQILIRRRRPPQLVTWQIEPYLTDLRPKPNTTSRESEMLWSSINRSGRNRCGWEQSCSIALPTS